MEIIISISMSDAEPPGQTLSFNSITCCFSFVVSFLFILHTVDRTTDHACVWSHTSFQWNKSMVTVNYYLYRLKCVFQPLGPFNGTYMVHIF